MADYSSYKVALGYTGDWSVPQHAHIDATEEIATEVETARNGQATLNSGLQATYQPKDATLTALAGVITAADKLIYATGVDTFSTTTLASAGRTFLATPSSANLAAMVTDETGSGALVFATSPTLITPTIGVATATSVNKVGITAPATSATLTIANGATLATVGAYSTTLTSTAATNVTLPTTGTLATLAGSETLTNKTLTSPTVSGNATVNNGNVILSSGYGIDFSATGGSAGIISNSLLDDYEEGSFTPTITFGGAAVGVTYSTQTGKYTKIGNVVNYAMYILLSSKGSSVGSLSVLGLPVASTDVLPIAACIRGGVLTSGVGDTYLQAIVQQGASTIQVTKIVSGTQTVLADTDLTNTSSLAISGHYII